jgi:hypothetical protein
MEQIFGSISIGPALEDLANTVSATIAEFLPDCRKI